MISVYRQPDAARYISIDEAGYFPYVTETENVYFYKVYHDQTMKAMIHLECFHETLYMSIVVIPQYRRSGLASKILCDIQSGRFPFHYHKIEVSIDESNLASIHLFEKMGFIQTSKEDELISYIYLLNPTKEAKPCSQP